MDIAFLFPPGGQRPEFQIHLGVSYIQASLKQHNLQSTQVIPAAGSTLDECVDAVLATGAPVVGLTCFDNSYYLVHQLALRFKQRRPDITVLVGGPSATFSDQLILENTPAIDLCIRYEAETIMPKLLPLLLDGVSRAGLKEVPGVSFLDGNQLIRTADGLQVGATGDDSLDALPSPFLNGILNGTEGTGLLTARGCTHRCTYCNFSALGRHRVRYHSVDRVLAELHHIQAGLAASPDLSLEKRLISIHDDAFTLNAPRAKEICQRIIDADLKLQLSCLVRVDNLDEELVILLKQAGFFDISFGLESAVPRVLRNIKKVSSSPAKAVGESYAPERRYLRQVENGVALAKKHDLSFAFSVILGLPGETREDGLATMAFVDKLEGQAVMQNFLMAFPGTEIFSTAADYNIGIQQSEYKLPYRTSHAYAVADIPLHKKSSLQKLSRSLAREVVRMFTNDTTAQPWECNGIRSALIIAKAGENIQPALAWLADTMAVCSTLIVLGDAASDISDFRKMVASCAEAGVPTRESFFFHDNPQEGATACYKPVAKHTTWWPFIFPIVPLAQRRAYLSQAGESGPHTWLLYTLESEQDVAMLKALAAQQQKAGLIMDGALVDGCRWCAKPCQALNLSRVVVNATGEVKGCLSGPIIGTIGQSLKEMRAHTLQLRDKVRRQRGCAACSVEDVCACCLDTKPLTVENYCALQRSSTIGQLVATTNLTHMYHPGVG